MEATILGSVLWLIYSNEHDDCIWVHEKPFDFRCHLNLKEKWLLCSCCFAVLFLFFCLLLASLPLCFSILILMRFTGSLASPFLRCTSSHTTNTVLATLSCICSCVLFYYALNFDSCVRIIILFAPLPKNHTLLQRHLLHFQCNHLTYPHSIALSLYLARSFSRCSVKCVQIRIKHLMECFLFVYYFWNLLKSQTDTYMHIFIYFRSKLYPFFCYK